MSMMEFFGLGSIGHQMSLKRCMSSFKYVVLFKFAPPPD